MSSAESNKTLVWSDELDRLSELVSQLVSANAKLTADNRRLRAESSRLNAALSELQNRSPDQATQLQEQLDRERAVWQKQRQAFADRLEVILGKFQWIDSKNQRPAPAEV